MASKKRSYTQIDDAVLLKQTSAVANLLELHGVTGAVTTSLYHEFSFSSIGAI